VPRGADRCYPGPRAGYQSFRATSDANSVRRTPQIRMSLGVRCGSSAGGGDARRVVALPASPASPPNPRPKQRTDHEEGRGGTKIIADLAVSQNGAGDTAAGAVTHNVPYPGVR
jgi:hypothetical protein